MTKEVEDLLEPQDGESEDEDTPCKQTGEFPTNVSILMPDTEINSKICSLNTKQREIFEVINKCAINYIKNRSSVLHNDILTLHLFVTGSGGCGKSQLIKTVYHSLTKTSRVLRHGSKVFVIKIRRNLNSNKFINKKDLHLQFFFIRKSCFKS